MKYLTFIFIGLIFHSLIKSQDVDLSDKWIKSFETNSGYIELDRNKFVKIDFSKILSNQLRIENDPISTYIGIFGQNYHRIDFHLEVIKNGQDYSVTGKSKLGDNVRDLNGIMRLEKVLLIKDHFLDSLFIGLFDCTLREPGDRDGDGVFSGVFTLVFYKKNSDVQFFSSDSGDEPTFTNTFVGKWTKNNSNVERKVIFSFHPAGLYKKLPFCEELYTFEEFEDFIVIKDKYKKYGWMDFNPHRGQKTDWWK